MTEVVNFLKSGYDFITSLSFTTLLTVILCVFLGMFVLVLILSLCSPIFSQSSKRPFFALVNVFTGLVLALFSTEYQISFSVFASAVFWVIGYCLYGVLTLTYRKKKNKTEPCAQTLSLTPLPPPVADKVRPDVPAAKSEVRIEHALSMTDKLLLKNLGRGDRQELEKMRHTLLVLQSKKEILPNEGEILNEDFNTLLKLMAKYGL